jgi:3-oxoadipate enol-lactonase
MQAIGEGLRCGGLDDAEAAWLHHDFFVPAQGTPDLARRLAEMVGDYSGVNRTSADPHAPHPNSIELLTTIAAPTTVVIGALDVPCFHEMSEVLADRIPGARKLTAPGVGHMVNMEAPEAGERAAAQGGARPLAHLTPKRAPGCQTSGCQRRRGQFC